MSNSRDKQTRPPRDKQPRNPRATIELPPITYPAELPVSAHRDEIAAAIAAHQVVIVAGATGSGKTTQIPKIVLELGRGRSGQIGHTQPRRIAARTVAERLSAELGTALGTTVGYQVRFTDTTRPETFVRVMTDGILLAQIQRDPTLSQYDTLIIDEAHERSLNIDFILGYLSRLLPQRPDLKLIITSATIDSERFAAHFAKATSDEVPVIEVSGRTYPVEVRYRPLTLEMPGRPVIERDQNTAINQAVDELAAEGPGDILVFLSGEREIRDAAESLAGHLTRSGTRETEILPLYGRQSAAEQHRVFAPHAGRRIVLATNVAETSLTVPSVRYVIDTGTARISRYSKATKVQRLPIEPISQASANQRSGRCGRVADGIAIRLYSEQDFQSREEFTEPEILRTSLASVILHMISAGVVRTIDDVATFPFIDPPDGRAIRDGVTLLTELGALTVRGADERPGQRARLTPVGRSMAALPVDPRLARMIVEAGRRGVAREVTIIAAALSIQDVRERPAEQRATADALHARFADPSSDFLAYLNLWEYLRDLAKELSSSAFRRRVRSEHLNYLRVREWQDLVAQLRESAKGARVVMNPVRRPGKLTVTERVVVKKAAAGAEAYAVEQEQADAYRLAWDGEPIHRSILVGLLAGLGAKIETDVGAGTGRRSRGPDRPHKRKAPAEYAGSRGARFAIFPASALAKSAPDLVMAAELVETSRLWAREVAAVSESWVEEAGAHLLKRSYADPRWSSKQGAALITEKVTILGVPLVAGRAVLLARVDPEAAREMFIREALVAGKWRTHHRFWHANQEALAAAQELAARARRHDVVVDDSVIEEFYDERLPDTIVSARHFDTWLKREGKHNDLLFPPGMLLAETAQDLDTDAFPTTWRHGDLTLSLSYEFAPGEPADGIVVHIPLGVLERVTPAGFDWLVPGRREELVTALIRTLPKAQRTPLVPAPDMARRLLPLLADPPEATSGLSAPITVAIAEAVRAHLGLNLDPELFEPERLPRHLRPTFRVTAADGLETDHADLITLQRQLAPQAASAMSDVVKAALAAASRAADEAAQDSAQTWGGSGSSGAGGVSATGDAGTAPIPATLADVIGRELTTFDAELPQVITAGDVVSYPGLVWSDEAARPQVHASPNTRDREHRTAVRHLLVQELALAPARVTSRWSSALALQLAAHPYPSTDALVTDLHLAAVDALLDDEVPVTPAQYAAVRDRLRPQLEDEILAVATAAGAALAPARELRLRLESVNSLALLATATDLRDWLDDLIGPGFIATAGKAQLTHLPRYLRAAHQRLDTAVSHPAREEKARWQVREAENEYQTVAAGLRDPSPAQVDGLHGVRWLLEEFRVSLFAQGLGTAQPVSAKRIRSALAAVQAS